SSASVHYAAVAIGALNASRLGTPPLLTVAYRSSQHSMQALRQSIDVYDHTSREAVLWTSLLLGIFELLADSSGDAWPKHMLCGVSRVLKTTRSVDGPSPLDSAFIEMFSILEANRTIMYGNTTMLADAEWEPSRRLSTGHVVWCPMSEILTLVVCISTWSAGFLEYCEWVGEAGGIIGEAGGPYFGLEGIELQTRLNDWYANASRIEKIHEQFRPFHFKLAMLYHQALVIYLCRQFDYYSYWNEQPRPLLNRQEALCAVITVLDVVEDIMSSPGTPGVLLLFPLRMAALHASSTKCRAQLSHLLDRIYWQGYVVTHRVLKDVREVWAYMDSTADVIDIG
ncbi:hypothetical protein LTR56_027949, partial [Elasticomyces elasticus]